MTEVAVFGGGCFWCTEAIFSSLRGVIKVTSGYAGVVEVVRIEFDPQIIDFENLLEVFFATHDPTSIDRQGADVGPQYKSVIFYTTFQQKTVAEKLVQPPMVTEIKEFRSFVSAEGYHQKFYASNPSAPYCQLVINPKLAKLRQKFAGLIK